MPPNQKILQIQYPIRKLLAGTIRHWFTEIVILHDIRVFRAPTPDSLPRSRKKLSDFGVVDLCSARVWWSRTGNLVRVHSIIITNFSNLNNRLWKLDVNFGSSSTIPCKSSGGLACGEAHPTTRQRLIYLTAGHDMLALFTARVGLRHSPTTYHVCLHLFNRDCTPNKQFVYQVEKSIPNNWISRA